MTLPTPAAPHSPTNQSADTQAAQEQSAAHLLENHVAYLKERGIPIEVALCVGARSLPHEEVGKVLGRSTVGCGGLGLPYPGEPSFWRVRLDEAVDGAKFLTPAGVPVRPYIPPDNVVSASVWQDPKISVVLVEGPWKGLALAAAGIPAIGLAGCSAGGHDAEKRRTGEAVTLHPHLLDRVIFKKRKVFICMDAGREWNPNVRRGEELLAEALSKAGAKVFIVHLPPKNNVFGKDQGPDDFLAAHGGAAFHALIDRAVRWVPHDDKGHVDFAQLEQVISGFKSADGSVLLPIRSGAPGRLGFNLMTSQITIDETPIGDHDIDQLRLLLSQHGTQARREDLWSAVGIVARRFSFHKVRTYLDQLVWDGVKRVDRIASEILHLKPAHTSASLGAATDSTTPHDPLALQTRFIWCCLLSAVSRAQRPGCKVDTVLVLKGPQGAGKSTFFLVLASPELFGDSDLDVSDPQTTPMVMGSKWICEFPELENFKRARELTQVKAFLSRASDLYRPPYGRSVVEHPRSSIIVATTNEEEFLADPTGNRRFHVLEVAEPIDIDLLKQWRDQIWAEVMVAFRNGVPHWLSPQDEQALAASQAHFATTHPWTSTVEDWLHRNSASAEPLPVTYTNILKEALDKSPGEMKKADQMAVAEVLTALGWRSTRSGTGARMRYWAPPPGWEWRKNAPPSDADSLLPTAVLGEANTPF